MMIKRLYTEKEIFIKENMIREITSEDINIFGHWRENGMKIFEVQSSMVRWEQFKSMLVTDFKKMLLYVHTLTCIS